MNRLTLVRVQNGGKKLLLLICLAAVCVCGYFLVRMLLIEEAQKIGQQEYWHLSEEMGPEDETPEERLVEVQLAEPLEVLPEYADMLAEYPNFAGWISIPDTEFSYPVMIAPEEDPNYYLFHNYEGTRTDLGCPYIPYYSSYDADNVMIYGHHIRNHRMFGFLENYQDEDFYNEHRFIFYDTPYQHRIYYIVSVMIISVEDPRFHFQDFVNWGGIGQSHFYNQECYDRNIFDSDTLPDDGDKLLTLVTCEYSIPNGKGRLVIVAQDVTAYDTESEN